MLHFQAFDLKTGKALTDFNPGTERTQRVKQVVYMWLIFTTGLMTQIVFG
jgi:hypothetical protein